MNGKAPSGREWLNTKGAAEYACISYETFTKWQRGGKLPFRWHKISSRIRLYDPEDIDNWIQSQRKEPSKEPITLNALETACYVGIGRTTLYEWIRDNKVPFPMRRMGLRIIRFKKSDIDKWLHDNNREPGIGPVFPRKRKKKEGPM